MVRWTTLLHRSIGGYVNHRSRNTTLALVATATLLSACSAAQDMAAKDVPVQVPGSATGTPDIGNAQGETDNPGSTDNQQTTDSDQPNSNEPDSTAQPEGTDDSTSTEAPNESTDATLIANAASVTCSASPDTFRATMLAMVNASRQAARQCGTSAAPATGVVQWNDQLAVAANNHAIDMATVNFFDHTGSNGLGVSDRAEAAGYDWRAVGENIAAGQFDIEEAHQGWLDSPGHCRNIMNNLYTEIGAACVSDSNSDFNRYWVVVFGDQR